MILRGLLVGGALLLAGCAHPPVASCGNSGDVVASLQCRAWSGDKLAQLEMGKRLESGDGVAIDLRQAARFYRMAAQDVSGTTYVYSPPVGKHGRAMVLPIRTGSDQPGLSEAKYRLSLMYRDGRGVRRNAGKAERLINEARDQGYLAPSP